MHAITISTFLAVAVWAGPIVERAAESDASYFTGELTPAHQIIETTDTRVSGSVSRTTNVDWYTISAPDSFLTVANSWRIENERGAWAGHSTGFAHFPDWDDLDTETAAETVVLTGEDGYVGLSAIIDVRSTSGGPIAVTGVVFRGEIPPLPKAPVTTDAGRPPTEGNDARSPLLANDKRRGISQVYVRDFQGCQLPPTHAGIEQEPEDRGVSSVSESLPGTG